MAGVQPTQTGRLRRRTKLSLVLLGVIVATVLATPLALRSIGRGLVTTDPLQRANVVAITPESGIAGELEAVMLLESGAISRIIVMAPSGGRIERELKGRGLNVDEMHLRRLRDLGVPPDRLTLLRAGEGGTQDVATTLADWSRGRETEPVLLITGAAHARRVGRVVRRHWPGPGPPPAVRIARLDSFHPDRWWRSRGSLRQGLVEIQKLALDYVQHPLP
jgi:uncharacterized SAM-binding protein YcdF (DUF218 family)